MSEISPAPVTLLVPGIDGSGLLHWQTIWERTRRDCRKVDLGDWSRPQPLPWMAALDRAIRDQAGAPVTLVAHSLGCILVAWWAHHHAAAAARVTRALLVAPCDPQGEVDARLHCFHPLPGRPLPFPVLVAASRNDPYATPAWSARFARALGGAVVDVGAVGHINAASGVGDWAQGQHLLETLRPSEAAAPRRPPRAQANGS